MKAEDLINQLTDSEPVNRSCRTALFRSNGEKIQVLLACNTGIDEWSLPGSDSQEQHETAKESAERGLFEETGILTTVDFLMNEDAQLIPRAIFYSAVDSAMETSKPDTRWVDVDMIKECDPPLDIHDVQAIEAALKKVHNPDAIVEEAFEKAVHKLAIVGMSTESAEAINALRAMRALDNVTEVVLLSQQPQMTDESIEKQAWEAIAEERGLHRDIVESIRNLRK